MALALGIVLEHLTAVKTGKKEGRYQPPHDLKATLGVVKVMGSLPGVRGQSAREVKRRVREATTEELLEEASKHPELADALASLEEP
jgi:hypothetical protein